MRPPIRDNLVQVEKIPRGFTAKWTCPCCPLGLLRANPGTDEGKHARKAHWRKAHPGEVWKKFLTGHQTDAAKKQREGTYRTRRMMSITKALWYKRTSDHAVKLFNGRTRLFKGERNMLYCTKCAAIGTTVRHLDTKICVSAASKLPPLGN